MSDELKDFLTNFAFIYADCSDTFHYASADAERIYLDEESNTDILVDVYRQFGADGIRAYCSKIRGYQVLKELRNDKYHEAMKFLEDWSYDSD